jgi:hypothetical protein
MVRSTDGVVRSTDVLVRSTDGMVRSTDGMVRSTDGIITTGKTKYSQKNCRNATLSMVNPTLY